MSYVAVSCSVLSFDFQHYLAYSVTWFPVSFRFSVSFDVSDVASPYAPLLHSKDENLVVVMSLLLDLNNLSFPIFWFSNRLLLSSSLRSLLRRFYQWAILRIKSP